MTLRVALMLLAVSLQILCRHTGIVPRYVWTEEVARFCFVWIIMLGAMVAVRDETHFDVDLMPLPKTPRDAAMAKLTVHLAMMLMAVVFAWYGIEFAKTGFVQSSEMSGINMLSIYISFPIAGISWIVFLAEKIAADIRQISTEKAKPQT